MSGASHCKNLKEGRCPVFASGRICGILYEGSQIDSGKAFVMKACVPRITAPSLESF